jgi:hypothetical protein
VVTVLVPVAEPTGVPLAKASACVVDPLTAVKLTVVLKIAVVQTPAPSPYRLNVTVPVGLAPVTVALSSSTALHDVVGVPDGTVAMLDGDNGRIADDMI